MLTYYTIIATLATLALLVIAAACLSNAIVVARAGRRVMNAACRVTDAVTSGHALARRFAPVFEQAVTNAAASSDSPRWSDLIAARHRRG